MSRDPIRNELRGLDNWLTCEPDRHQGDERDETQEEEVIFNSLKDFDEDTDHGWMTPTDEEWGYPSLEAAKEGYRLDIDSEGKPRKQRGGA
jgi:hypothetical protein